SSEESSSEAEEEQQEEEHVPLTYQIPTETLRIAMTASPSSGAAYWRHDLYRGPLDQKISMHYCKNIEVSERVAKYFVEEKVLGFDIEWKPNASTNDGIRGNTSLIQLASEDRIALFHIALFKGNTVDELLPPTLKKIMESPDITKAGVAVRGDCTRLQKHLGIESKGMFELSHLYRLVKFSATEPKKVNKVLVSLARQVEEHLQLPLSKGPVRESDWSKALLYEQMLYAASDAYAGFRLYDALEAKRKKLKPTPPRPEHAELNMPIRLATSAKVVTAQKSSAVIPDEDSSDAEEDFETAPEDAEESEDGIETPSADGSSEADDLSDAEFIPSTRRIGRPTPVTVAPKSAEYLRAEAWVEEWRTSLPEQRKPRASAPMLKAYALWHSQSLGLGDVAAHLRDPPLAISTVSSYVLTTILLESLPFDAVRIKEPLGKLPRHVVQTRYKSILKKMKE
ncbi:ribonuclease H-like protein, partial [Cenococcum geophilum]